MPPPRFRSPHRRGGTIRRSRRRSRRSSPGWRRSSSSPPATSPTAGGRSEHERAHALPRLARPAGARRAREPRPPVHVPGALHAPVERVRAALGDDGADVRLPHAARRRAELGAAVPAPGRRAPRASSSRAPSTACARRRTARTASSSSTTISSARRGAPRASARCRTASAVLDALAADGAELILGGHIHQAAVSERREFEVVDGGVRDDRRLDRARPRPAAPAPRGRGARAPRLRDRRADAHRRHVHLARGRPELSARRTSRAARPARRRLAQPLEQAHLRRRVLLVREDAGVVQLLEQPEVVRRVLRRVVRRRVAARRRPRPRGPTPPDSAARRTASRSGPGRSRRAGAAAGTPGRRGRAPGSGTPPARTAAASARSGGSRSRARSRRGSRRCRPTPDRGRPPRRRCPSRSASRRGRSGPSARPASGRGPARRSAPGRP